MGDVTLGYTIHLTELGTGSSHSKVVTMWLVKYLGHPSNANVSINGGLANPSDARQHLE
jgi:hypothetical protein